VQKGTALRQCGKYLLFIDKINSISAYTHTAGCINKSRSHFLKTNIFYLPLALVSHSVTMILSFGDKNTEKIWSGETVKKVPLEIQKIGRRKLRMIHNSQDVVDLRIPPSNRLEKLKGKLRNFYSIRINDQWRIIFIWDSNNAEQVQIIDYHK